MMEKPREHFSMGGAVFKRKREDEPCIWPIISSLSSLSVPASRSSLPPRDSRNFLESPTNQFSQKGLVAERSVRHLHWDGDEVVVEGLSSVRRGGTETRAELVLRMVRERVCHSMPLAREGKEVGRVER
jgi:hypothetical protein